MSKEMNQPSNEKTNQIEQREKWATKHKDSIDFWFKILGFIAAAAVVIYMQCQIESSEEQTREQINSSEKQTREQIKSSEKQTREQIKSSEKQAKAVWQSFRPALDIKAINAVEDIREADSIPNVNIKSFSDSTIDGSKSWLLYYTIHNYGHSPAKLMSIYYERVSQGALTTHVENWTGTSLVQGVGVVRRFPLALSKSTSSKYLKISIEYGWEAETDTQVTWFCTKLYRIWNTDERWHSGITTDSIYNSYRDKIPEEMRFKWRH